MLNLVLHLVKLIQFEDLQKHFSKVLSYVIYLSTKLLIIINSFFVQFSAAMKCSSHDLKSSSLNFI